MNSEPRDGLSVRAFSENPHDRVVTADEVARWPDGTLAELLDEGLLEKIEQPATTVECDACTEAHVEEVQFVEEPPDSTPRAYIPCPESGRVAVDPERMRRWRISPKTIDVSRAVGKAGQSEGRENGSDEAFTPEMSWPPTAAAFVSILRQAKSAGAPGLRWNQIKQRLATVGYFPHRVRDVKRNVPDWDGVIASPRRGYYRIKA